MLLPIVLGFSLTFEQFVLPPEHRMRGWYKVAIWSVSLPVIGFGLYMGDMLYIQHLYTEQ